MSMMVTMNVADVPPCAQASPTRFIFFTGGHTNGQEETRHEEGWQEEGNQEEDRQEEGDAPDVTGRHSPQR
jgi:hypothetical protein